MRSSAELQGYCHFCPDSISVTTPLSPRQQVHFQKLQRFTLREEKDSLKGGGLTWFWTEEMAHWIMLLLHKHVDLSSNPQETRKASLVARIYKSSVPG